MGLDEKVTPPLYVLKDGQLYIHSMGALVPLTVGNAGKRAKHHRVDAHFYARADPDKSKAEAVLADALEALIEEHAGSRREA